MSVVIVPGDGDTANTKVCPLCRGSGTNPTKPGQPCTMCKGTGRVPK